MMLRLQYAMYVTARLRLIEETYATSEANLDGNTFSWPPDSEVFHWQGALLKVREQHQVSEMPVQVGLGAGQTPNNGKTSAWIRKDLEMWAEGSRHMLEATHMVILQRLTRNSESGVVKQMTFLGFAAGFRSSVARSGAWDSEAVRMPTWEAWRTLARSSFRWNRPPRSCFFDGNIQAIGDRSGADAVFRNRMHMYFSLFPETFGIQG